MLDIIFVTQDDPFYLPLFFDSFQKKLESSEEGKEMNIHGMLIQKPLGKNRLSTLIKQMYDFYGAWNFFLKGILYSAYKVLNMIAVHLFKGKFPGLYSVEHFAKKHDWPVLDHKEVNSPSFIEFVKNENIDLLISVGASQKFKKEILEAPKYGCINLHNSKLPKLRGMLPTFWALLDYENNPVSASTIFKMDENLDSGPIILQEEFRLIPDESLEKLIKRTKRQGAELMFQAILLFKNGTPSLRENDSELATYRSFPTSEDIKRFREKGYKLL